MPAIAAIVRRADPEQPVSNVRLMEEIVADQTASRAVQARVLGLLALVAILLAGIGIHGLLSFAVTARTREIAVAIVCLGTAAAGAVAPALRAFRVDPMLALRAK